MAVDAEIYCTWNKILHNLFNKGFSGSSLDFIADPSISGNICVCLALSSASIGLGLIDSVVHKLHLLFFTSLDYRW